MKKLLALAVLALGLCASPAMASIIDFTKDIVPDSALSSTSWHAGGVPAYLYYYPGSTEGVAFDMSDYPYEHTRGFESLYKSADGLSLDLAPRERLHLSFTGETGQEQLIKDLTIRLSGQGLAWVFSYKNSIGNADWGMISELDTASVITLDPIYWGYSPDLPVTALIILNYGNATQTFTIASIEYGASSAVPVPAAVWLLATGVAGVAALRRKFK